MAMPIKGGAAASGRPGLEETGAAWTVGRDRCVAVPLFSVTLVRFLQPSPSEMPAVVSF